MRVRMDNVSKFARELVTIQESGSLSAAARKLNVTQPTLSRMLADLEETLGFALFVRHARGVRAKAEAEPILKAAQHVLAAMQGMERAALATREVGGTIRLTTSEYIGIAVIIPSLQSFLDTYPALQIELVLDNTPRDLRRGEADLALRLFRPTESDLIARRLAKIPLGFYASKHYLETRGEPKSLDEALDHQLVGFDSKGPFAQALRSVDSRLAPETFRVQSDSLMAQLESIRGNLGVGVLQIPHAQRFPELQQILRSVQLPPLEVWMAIHKDMKNSATLKTFVEWVETELQNYVRNV